MMMATIGGMPTTRRQSSSSNNQQRYRYYYLYCTRTLVMTSLFISFSVSFMIVQINFFDHLFQISSESTFESKLKFTTGGTGGTGSSSSRSIISNWWLYHHNREKSNHFHSPIRVMDLLDSNISQVQRYILRPRIAIVIPINKIESTTSSPIIPLLAQSISSILSTIPSTDHDRILSITIITFHKMDNELKALNDLVDNMNIPINVIFTEYKIGLNQDISDAVDGIQDLVTKLEKHGFKSPYEDITLLFMKVGSQIVTNGWLDVLSEALMGFEEEEVEVVHHHENGNEMNNVVKPANAISFRVEGSQVGEIYAVNSKTLLPEIMNIKNHLGLSSSLSSSSSSYPTPIIEGSVTAMKLQTYLMLPVKDGLINSFQAINIELSFNLWMCGDGIDILPQLIVTKPPSSSQQQQPSISESSTTSMSRLMETWLKIYVENNNNNNMDPLHDRRHAKFRPASRVKMDIKSSLPSTNYCRDYKWYIETVKGESSLEYEKMLKGTLSDQRKHDRDEDHGIIFPTKSLKEYGEILNSVTPISLSYDNSTRGTQPNKIDDGREEESHNQKEQENSNSSKKLAKEKTKKNKKEKIRRYVGISKTYAIDQNGNQDYVYNVTSLKSNPPNFTLDGLLLDSICNIHDETWKVLTEKVSIDFKGHERAEINAKLDPTGKPRVKLMCIVYTIESDHNRIPAIRETWGQKCDGFIVASTKTDLSLGTVEIKHDGQDVYKEIWQKVQAIWSYIYDHYYDDFDWFHIGGDGRYC